MGRGSALFIRKTILSSQKCLKPLVPRQEKTLLAGSWASFSQNALNLPWLCSSPPIGPLPLAAALPETPIWGLLRLPLPTWEPELQPEDAGCGGKKRDDARRAGFFLLLTHCLSGASGLCVSLLTDRMKEPEGITVMIRTILTFFYGVQFVFAYEFVWSQLLCEVIWKSILSLFLAKRLTFREFNVPQLVKGESQGPGVTLMKFHHLYYRSQMTWAETNRRLLGEDELEPVPWGGQAKSRLLLMHVLYWGDERVSLTSGLRLKALAGFPTQRKSKMISFIAKSKRS